MKNRETKMSFTPHQQQKDQFPVHLVGLPGATREKPEVLGNFLVKNKMDIIKYTSNRFSLQHEFIILSVKTVEIPEPN